MKKCPIPAFLCFFFLNQVLFGAEITVSQLDLVSQGAMKDGNLEIRSSMEAEISINGGYKYGFSLGLGAEIPHLGKAMSFSRLSLPYAAGNPPSDTEYNELIDELNDRLNNQAVFSVRSIQATIREVFDKPLEISFFIGRYEKLSGGDEFQEYFGTVPIGTGLRGFFYYPEGLNGNPLFRFDGSMHTIMGTGLAFKAVLGNFIPVAYIYHDTSFLRNQGGSYQPGRYSVDFKLLANKENTKFEVFFGGTYAADDSEIIRGGALAWFGGGPFSFLMQVGITYYEFGAAIDIDNCYFLMEPRLRFNKYGANLTFFYHPVYYQNKIIRDGTDKARGRADINLRVFYSDIRKSAFEGGLEALVNLKVQNGEDFTFWISPFISTVTTGLKWDIALRVNPLYFRDGGELMEGFVGIRTSY